MNNKAPLAIIILPVVVFVAALTSIAWAQFSGSRGGVDGVPHGHATISAEPMDLAVQQYISVEGNVEIRVPPDQIRIVLAVTDLAETSAECEQKVFTRISELRESLKQKGIPEAEIVDDFIAILPQYQFEIENRGGDSYAVERKTGYQLQSNLHIRVETDQQAMTAIRTAFAAGVTDIIAVDYWCRDLDGIKTQVLEKALKQARDKADLLLAGTFEQRPDPVNIRSTTEVILPQSLYTSFENSNSESYNQPYRNRDNLPVIRTFRPKNTYYQGYFNSMADQQPDTLPMNSEISVVSTVKLFFASPVAVEYRRLENPPGVSAQP